MMRIMEKVYTTDKLKYKRADLKQQISRQENVGNLHVIVLNRRADDQIEIIKCRQLYQPCYPTDELVVIGFAESRKEAEHLIMRMTEDAIAATGSIDLKRFVCQLLEDTPTGVITWL